MSDYLVASSHYSPDTEDYLKNLTIAHDLCIKNGDLSNALRISIKMDDEEKIKAVWNKCEDRTLKKQLAFMLGRQRYIIECDDDELVEIYSNSLLSEFFVKLGEDMGVSDPKTPEDVLKTALEGGPKK
jgi:26S proteasome regulatory subunit N1